MNLSTYQKLLMSFLLPEFFYIDSGLRRLFGSDMFSLYDRVDRKYLLGPTHEEIFVDVCCERLIFF